MKEEEEKGLSRGGWETKGSNKKWSPSCFLSPLPPSRESEYRNSNFNLATARRSVLLFFFKVYERKRKKTMHHRYRERRQFFSFPPVLKGRKKREEGGDFISSFLLPFFHVVAELSLRSKLSFPSLPFWQDQVLPLFPSFSLSPFLCLSILPILQRLFLTNAEWRRGKGRKGGKGRCAPPLPSRSISVEGGGRKNHLKPLSSPSPSLTQNIPFLMPPKRKRHKSFLPEFLAEFLLSFWSTLLFEMPACSLGIAGI